MIFLVEFYCFREITHEQGHSFPFFSKRKKLYLLCVMTVIIFLLAYEDWELANMNERRRRRRKEWDGMKDQSPEKNER
jgi:hypothetical protein